MICKLWQWKGTKGWANDNLWSESYHNSIICTPSPIKTRAWRRSFIHYAGTEYIHASLKMFTLELLLFWKHYDIHYDKIISAVRIYWRGKKLAGLDRRH